MVSQLGVYPNTPYTGTTTVAPAASSRYTDTSYLDLTAPSDDFTSSDSVNLDSPTPSATPSATPSDVSAPSPTPAPAPAPAPVATPAPTPTTVSFRNAAEQPTPIVQPTPMVNVGYPAPVYYSSSRRVYGSNVPAPKPYPSQPVRRTTENRTFVASNYHNVDVPQEVPVKRPVYHSSPATNQADIPEVIPQAPKKRVPQYQPPVEKPLVKPSVKPVIIANTPVVANTPKENYPVNPFSLVPSHVSSSLLNPAAIQALGNPFTGGMTGDNFIPQAPQPSGGRHKGGGNWTQDLFGGILNNYFDGEQPSMDGITQVAGLQFTSGY